MEKQSTSKFLRSVIAVVALFMLVVSGLFLASCKEEECSHPTTNDFGACTECNVIVDWTKYEAKLDGIITPNFDDLTASLNDLKSNVSDVASDVDSVITKIGDIDLGADITTIVDTVNNIRDEIVALLGAEEVTDKATPATITGIAKALDDLQASVKKVQEDITGVEKVCKDHDFDTETLIEIIPASCTENGLGYYRCKNCNAVISDEIPTIDHTSDEPVKENEKAATCTEAGSYDEVVYCTVCGKEVSRVEKTVDALDHAWDEGKVTADPTCTTEGVKTFTCTREGCTVTKTEAVEATGHTADWSAPTVSEKPTCVADGSATFKCTNCEASFTLKPSDVATRPTFMSDEDWAAFVTAYKATGHDLSRQEEVWENVKLEQTDEKTGQIVDQVDRVTYKYCTNEGCNYKEEVSRVTENHQLYVSDDLTIREGNGDVRKVSTLSGEELTKYELKEGGKNFGKIKDGYVNLSCTETAYLFYLCPDECAVKPDNPIKVELEALGHYYVAGAYVEGEEPTCTEGGMQIYTCAYCEDTYNEPVGPLKHNLVKDEENSKPATCTEEGVEIKKCANAGCTYTEKTVFPAGHKWVDVEGSEEFTWTLGDVSGHYVSITQECSVCGATQKTEPELESHSKRFYDAKEVLGTELEQELYELYGVRIVEHAKYGYVFTTAACDDPGPVVNVCVCGYVETVPYTNVTSQQHSYIVTDIAADDPCTGIAIRHKVCKWCGAEVDIPLGDPAGHTWVVVAAQDPTCDTNGWNGFAYCEECGKVVMFTATADETEPDKMAIDYVEGVTCDGTEEEIEAVKDLKGIAIDALGHLWSSEPMVFCEDGCLSPVWEVTYCVRCFNYDADGDFTIKANGAEYPESAEGYVDTDFGAATDEFINKLLNTLNWAGSDEVPPVSFTKEQLLSDEFNGHYNITGIKFVAAKGHTLNETQSDEKTDAIVCLTDKALDSYADALAFAKTVYASVNEDEFKTAFDEIFGTNDTNRDGFVIDVNGDDAPTLAGICTECGMPIAITDHNEEYYMFMITNGKDGAAYAYSEPIDVENAYVHTDTYLVKDAEGNTAYKTQAEIDESNGAWTKVVFTYAQIASMKYTNSNGSVNCYFEGFCARNCGTDMGHKAQHTFPTSDNYDKYHNCMHGDICVWCSKVLALSDDHNMQDLEEIVASDNKEYADAAKALYEAAVKDPDNYDWVGKDTDNATCQEPAEDWTITVCVSCLLEWYKEGTNFEGWTRFDETDPESEGNYTSKKVDREGDHRYEIESVGDKDELNCLVGYAEWYQCSVCGDRLTYEERYAEDAPEYIKNLKDLHENDYIDDENYHEAKAHTVAPVFNYFENSNYKPATDTTSAYMNFICVDCGEPLQGYYDNGVAEDGKLRYTMASDEDIKNYLENAEKVAEWGNIQYVRAEDKAAVTTVTFEADATEDQKEAAVAKAIKDAEAEGATSVYLTIPGDFKIGASDTTTFTEGEATVWQAYGITFSADSSVKKIVFDLGDNKLTFAGTKVDEKTEAKVGATYKITGEGSVIFSNGTIEFTAFTAAQNPTFGFNANTTELVFDHITATVKGSAAFAGFGSTGEEAFGTMTIKNSKITTEGYYVVSTNASKSASSKVEINIIDSTLTSVQPDNDSVGIMFNVPGELNVSGSFVTADSQGMIIRGGDIKATIKDTEVTITDDCSEENAAIYKAYESKDWGSGNGVPMGAFVIGDRSTSYEVGLATVVLEEVTIKAPEDVNKVYVYAQEGDTTVDLTITNADAAAPTLEAADIVNGSNATNNAEVYKLTIDGAQVVPVPVVDEGNTEEAQG